MIFTSAFFRKSCHPERSEGSGQTVVKLRPSRVEDPSLTLRMTNREIKLSS
jgi:hypothetical protein